MSDSHVNDIRYTALWRPVVKAREAPAVSPPSPTPLLFSPPAALSDASLVLFQSHAISPDVAARFPFSFPLGKSTRAVSCSRDDFAGGIRRMRTWVRPQILFALMESTERAYALSTKGGGIRPRQLRPLRAQQPCVSPSGTRCCLCGDNRLSLMLYRRAECLPFIRLANWSIKSIFLYNILI